MAENKALTTRAADFSAWYNEVIARAELADYSPVRGCMVIRPNGYAIWEQMQRALDRMFKDTGHQNAYFPLFIPQSFLSREAEHVEGFAPEVAVVTHGGGKELEEPLIDPADLGDDHLCDVRQVDPELPRPAAADQPVVQRGALGDAHPAVPPHHRVLWQEGHTAHATEAEAEEETLRMLGVYRTFMEDWMAMPVLTGRKTDSERFAGALRTYSIEALMQDNKALQAGTSHNLGQNFAQAFEVTFQTANGELDHVWNTSWGVSTRLVGGADHDPQRRPGPGVPAEAGAVPGGHRSDLQDRRGARRRCSRPPTGCGRSWRLRASGFTWSAGGNEAGRQVL